MSAETTGQNLDQIRIALALRRAADQNLNALVRAAGQTACLLQGSKVEKSQVRNVQNVASATESTAVTTNFIRYQIGRKEEWRWKNFGWKVLQELEGSDKVVGRLSEKVSNEVLAQVSSADRDKVRKEASILLARLFLGYLDRWFTYGSKTGRWDDIEKATSGEESHVR